MNKNIQQQAEQMIPDIHKRMMPYVEEAASLYGGADNLNDEKLDKMAQHVVARSDLNSNPPKDYTESALTDIAKALILSRLFGGYGYNGYYPYPYYNSYYGYYPYNYNYYQSHGYYPYYPYGGYYGGYGGGYRNYGRGYGGFRGGYRGGRGRR